MTFTLPCNILGLIHAFSRPRMKFDSEFNKRALDTDLVLTSRKQVPFVVKHLATHPETEMRLTVD